MCEQSIKRRRQQLSADSRGALGEVAFEQD